VAQIRPIGDRVVVKPAAKEEVTKSGIVIPDTAKEKPQEGTVVAVGSGRLLDNGDRATDVIAQLTQFVPLDASTANRVDCAIAEVMDADIVRARVMSKVGKLRSDQPLDAVEGMRIEKVGRGTGYTTGTVFDVSATIALEYGLLGEPQPLRQGAV